MQLTQEVIKRLLHYDPETGVFTWLRPTNNRMKTGGVAGNVHPGRHRSIMVGGKKRPSGHLVFLYMEGTNPPNQVNHINGDILDDRWCNLKLATKTKNSRNARTYTSNTSGTTGVYWHSRDCKWMAQIVVASKRIHIGCFIHKQEAIEARRQAETEHGFHVNRGKGK